MFVWWLCHVNVFLLRIRHALTPVLASGLIRHHAYFLEQYRTQKSLDTMRLCHVNDQTTRNGNDLDVLRDEQKCKLSHLEKSRGATALLPYK